MVKRIVVVACILGSLNMSAWAAERDQALTRPMIIVRRCVERIETLGERSVQLIAHQAMRGVRLINHLQDQDLDAEAMAAAERGTAFVENVSKNAMAIIDRATAECVSLLTRLEAPPQAVALVEQAAMLAKEAVAAAEARARQAIADALAD